MRWNRLIAVALIAAPAAAQQPTASRPAVAASPALAAVDGRTITVQDFKELLLAHRKSGDQAQLVETLTDAGRKRILDSEVDRLLAATAARDARLDQDPAVARAIARAIDRVLADALEERETASLDLSDAALRRYYAAHSERFSSPPRIKARHIVVATREDAERALAEVRAGGDFAAIAAVRNVDQTKATGGELGWVAKGVMVKPFEDALFALQPGQVSGVVQTRFGFHVIKAEEIDAGAVKPFERVAPLVRQALIDAHLADVRARLARKYPVTVNDDAFRLIGK